LKRNRSAPSAPWSTIRVAGGDGFRIAAVDAGYTAFGSDIIDRRGDSYSYTDFRFFIADFLKHPSTVRPWSAVFNPPYTGDNIREFVERALQLVRYKVAALVPLRRLPAAHWFKNAPLESVYLLTPRPSCPTGAYILAGNQPGGGGQDFAWLVFNVQSTIHEPRMRWLHRDGLS
jgi:hypothetical protein